MKTVFIILMTLFIASLSYARNKSGRITNEQQSPLEYEFVVLLNADSTLLRLRVYLETKTNYSHDI